MTLTGNVMPAEIVLSTVAGGIRHVESAPGLHWQEREEWEITLEPLLVPLQGTQHLQLWNQGQGVPQASPPSGLRSWVSHVA